MKWNIGLRLENRLTILIAENVFATEQECVKRVELIAGGLWGLSRNDLTVVGLVHPDGKTYIMLPVVLLATLGSIFKSRQWDSSKIVRHNHSTEYRAMGLGCIQEVVLGLDGFNTILYTEALS